MNKNYNYIYENLKVTLKNNMKYDALAYLILRIEFVLEEDALAELQYSQLQYPYLKNVKIYLPNKNLMPCYSDIKITDELYELLKIMKTNNNSDFIFENKSIDYYSNVFKALGCIFSKYSILKYRKCLTINKCDILKK